MSKNPHQSLDDIRVAFPGLGLALYAITPGEPIVLEVHGLDGNIYTFSGPTEQAVIDQAFPPREPEPDVPAETTSVTPTPPTTNVFD